MTEQQHTEETGGTWARDPQEDAAGAIARGIISRADHQGWKGKKGDANALEAVMGALTAAIAIYGNEHALTQRLSMLGYLTSIRGLAYVRERAAQAAPAPKPE